MLKRTNKPLTSKAFRRKLTRAPRRTPKLQPAPECRPPWWDLRDFKVKQVKGTAGVRVTPELNLTLDKHHSLATALTLGTASPRAIHSVKRRLIVVDCCLACTPFGPSAGCSGKVLRSDEPLWAGSSPFPDRLSSNTSKLVDSLRREGTHK